MDTESEKQLILFIQRNRSRCKAKTGICVTRSTKRSRAIKARIVQQSDINVILWRWFVTARPCGYQISGPILQEAKEIVDCLGVVNGFWRLAAEVEAKEQCSVVQGLWRICQRISRGLCAMKNVINVVSYWVRSQKPLQYGHDRFLFPSTSLYHVKAEIKV